MIENEEDIDHLAELQEEPASELLPDRDVLMMEKPLQDNRASRFRPADKKLLRNFLLIMLFLIAVLVILMIIFKKSTSDEVVVTTPAPAESAIVPGTK